ncbi:MAG: riboflavin synthase [Cloacibacillus sp.]
MFTGLIETVGTVSNLQKKGDVTELTISAPKIAHELKIGDSVAISGACSTVTACGAGTFSVEMMPETLKRTKLGGLRPGGSVNLERAMRLDSRLDGHLVAGHVDGMAVLEKVENAGKTRQLFFKTSKETAEGIVPKGSITIDGVSLTVIDAKPEGFSVGIIPTTLADTTLGFLRTGDTVNIETDMMGKYIKKYLDARFSGNIAQNDEDKVKNTLTWDKLSEYGWN